MKFIMNNRDWEIKEKDEKEMQDYMNDKENSYFGLTIRSEQQIWLNKDLAKGQKRQTLMHELMHCYVSCFISLQELTYNEESICDISANAHDIIEEITRDYFNTKD